MIKKKNNTLAFSEPPYIKSFASIVGKKEGEGPLSAYFDEIEEDEYFGKDSFEKAESEMLKRTISLALKKGELTPSDADMLFSGDLLNQCVSSAYGIRDLGIPFLGVFGACSTMAEGLLLSSIAVASGAADISVNATSSHFCTAERQFRFPLEYGAQRTPTAQWTATASGSIVLSKKKSCLKITHATIGKIVDKEIKDAANMGAAMAPAFCDTISSHLKNLGETENDYDLIVSGDLGVYGTKLTDILLSGDYPDISSRHIDCGMKLFDLNGTDVHAGASGCGCSASVLCGYILKEMKKGTYKRVLFAATGALMSAELSKQGESIPGISHAIVIERE